MKRILKITFMLAIYLLCSTQAWSQHRPKTYRFDDDFFHYIISFDEFGDDIYMVAAYVMHDKFGEELIFPDKVEYARSYWTIKEVGSYLSYYDDEQINAKKVTLPAHVERIFSETFFNAINLAEINFPKTLKSIGDRAFVACHSLTEIILPDSLSEIGEFAFKNCSNLASVSLPEGVKTIKIETFSMCDKLRTINFPSTLTQIEAYAFYECASLDSVDLHMIEKIGNEAFANCTNLKAVLLPTAIEWTKESSGWFGKKRTGIFRNCKGLKRIYNPHKTPVSIDPNVFEGVNQGECELYVPLESVELYKIAPVWSKFIVKGMDMSGIGDVPADRPAITPVARYNLQGSRLSGPQQGINIVRYSDGTTKKELVE